VTRLLTALGKQGARVVLLLAILVVSGVFLGLAAGYPVSRIQFEESDAVRLDQSRLAGEIDPAQAVVVQSDLPIGWDPGDPALAAFGLLGAEFCGEEVPLPTVLSDVEASVFANPGDQATLISQAVRVDRWQSARDYVDDVAEAVGECDRFFRTDLDGSRVRVDIDEGTASPPITDYVSRSFVAEDGSSVQTWSMMAVGDVVVVLLHGGPARPREGLLSDLEDRILVRIDPEDFAPGGVAPSTTSTTEVLDPTATTVLEGGAADESETPAVPPTVPPPPTEPPPIVDSEPTN
jgi:hypothetical protein